MPLRKFRCPQCDAIHTKVQSGEVNHDHECDKCGFEGHMPTSFEGARTDTQTEVDITYGKTDLEISELLVPDENGIYTEPY
jgi:hypothetical protein